MFYPQIQVLEIFVLLVLMNEDNFFKKTLLILRKNFESILQMLSIIFSGFFPSLISIVRHFYLFLREKIKYG